MQNDRLPIRLLLVLLVSHGCSSAPGAIDRELVCSAVDSPGTVSVGQGSSAWEWSEEARLLIDRHQWTAAPSQLIDGCGGGSRPVTDMRFNEDRSLAQITRSSFAAEASSEPVSSPPVEQYHSIETCLVRRERVFATKMWQPVACVVDAAT